jgi:hypothetical protein
MNDKCDFTAEEIEMCEDYVYKILVKLNRMSTHNILWNIQKKIANTGLDVHMLDCFRFVLTMGYKFKDKRIQQIKDNEEKISNILHAI